MAESGSTSRVLVVDDDELIRKLLTDLFTHDGYEVDAVEDARTALKLLLKNRYSLLTTDLELAAESGLGLIHEVRDRGLSLPILVISGNQEEILKAAVQNLGCAECLVKPFGIDAFRTAVVRLLAPRKPERTTKKEDQTPC